MPEVMASLIDGLDDDEDVEVIGCEAFALIEAEVTFARDFAAPASAVAEGDGLGDGASREWAVSVVPGTVGGLSASSAMVIEWRLGSFVGLSGAPNCQWPQRESLIAESHGFNRRQFQDYWVT